MQPADARQPLLPGGGSREGSRARLCQGPRLSREETPTLQGHLGTKQTAAGEPQLPPRGRVEEAGGKASQEGSAQKTKPGWGRGKQKRARTLQQPACHTGVQMPLRTAWGFQTTRSEPAGSSGEHSSRGFPFTKLAWPAHGPRGKPPGRPTGAPRPSLTRSFAQQGFIPVGYSRPFTRLEDARLEQECRSRPPLPCSEPPPPATEKPNQPPTRSPACALGTPSILHPEPTEAGRRCSSAYKLPATSPTNQNETRPPLSPQPLGPQEPSPAM